MLIQYQTLKCVQSENMILMTIIFKRSQSRITNFTAVHEGSAQSNFDLQILGCSGIEAITMHSNTVILVTNEYS